MNGIEHNSGLGQMFFDSLKKYDNNILVYNDDTNEAFTYKEIFIESIRTALRLKKKGIKRNDVIGVCSHLQKQICLPIIASQYLGALCTNFDPTLSIKDTVHLLKIVEPNILFVSEEILEFMESCLNEANIKSDLVVFGSSKKYSQFSEYLQHDEDENNFYPPIVDEKETAMILFSSGTTGPPKGICLSHQSLRKGGINYVPYNITNKNPTVSLMFDKFYWITAHVNLINCVVNGYSSVFCKTFDSVNFWSLIEKYKVTFTFLAAHNAFGCLNTKPENADCSTVEVVMTGGYPFSENLIYDLRKNFPYSKIVNVYGQTEAAGIYSYFDPTNEEEYNLQLKKPLSSGIMKNCLEWKILDIKSGEVLGSNKEGELRVKTTTPMNGYYKMDSSSAFDSDGFFKTGDTAYYDEDNCIYIVDRVREMFKFRGWHVHPASIEAILLSHPAVKEAAVIGVPHNQDRSHAMGVITLNDNYGDIDTNKILNYINDQVADYEKLRGGLKVIKSLPKTPNGKLKIRDIRKLILGEIK